MGWYCDDQQPDTQGAKTGLGLRIWPQEFVKLMIIRPHDCPMAEGAAQRRNATWRNFVFLPNFNPNDDSLTRHPGLSNERAADIISDLISISRKTKAMMIHELSKTGGWTWTTFNRHRLINHLSASKWECCSAYCHLKLSLWMSRLPLDVSIVAQSWNFTGNHVIITYPLIHDLSITIIS